MRYQTARQRHELVQNMPDPPQYVQGLITDGFGIVGAKSGFGKSWFCTQLATAIATGEDFLGRETKKSDVLYLDFESGDKLADNRLMKQLGDRPIPDNLYVSRDYLDWTFEGGKLEQQLEYIKNDTNIKVIIADIMKPIVPRIGKKETEYDVAYRFGTSIKHILDGTGIAFLGTMHCNKGSYNEEDPFNTILGSVGWQGVSDSAIVWQKKRRDDTRAFFSATGRIDKAINTYINFNPDTLLWELVGDTEEIREYEAKTEYERRPVTRIVKTLLGKEVSWRGTAQEAWQLYGDTTMSVDSIGRYLSSNNCKELKTRDGIDVVKRRTNKGAEYIISRDIEQTLTDLNRELYNI